MKFLIPFFFSTACFAQLDSLTLEKVNLDYVMPYGEGSVQKIDIGVSLEDVPLPIKVERKESALVFSTVFINFNWKNPWKFLHNMEALHTKDISFSLGGKAQSLSGPYLMVKPWGKGKYIGTGINGLCEGEFEGDIERRLLMSCHKKMEFSARRLELPEDFFLHEFISDLPRPLDEKRPLKELYLSSRNGTLYLSMYIKYLVTANLRAWGEVRYENNFNTIAIRVDKIKFGYFTLTKTLLKKLKESVDHPDVAIDPPWIRIDITKENERI